MRFDCGFNRIIIVVFIEEIILMMMVCVSFNKLKNNKCFESLNM